MLVVLEFHVNSWQQGRDDSSVTIQRSSDEAMEGPECSQLFWERAQHRQECLVPFSELVFVFVESGWVLIWVPWLIVEHTSGVSGWRRTVGSTAGRLVDYRPTCSTSYRMRMRLASSNPVV